MTRKPQTEAGYIAETAVVLDAVLDFLETRDGADLIYEMPPPEVLVIGPIEAFPPSWACNAVSLELVQHVARKCPEGTIAMFRTVLGAIAARVVGENAPGGVA
jgi:hypothetical protein